MLHSVVPTRILGVIPARFASSRFPGKALALSPVSPCCSTCGSALSRARYLHEILIIATDDERIRKCRRGFGARVRMTRADHLSGTDRVAEVAASESAAIIVNIQGDEPLIDPAAIDAAILVPWRTTRPSQWARSRSTSTIPREIGRSERGQSGDEHSGRRDLFFSLSDSVRARRAQRIALVLQAYWVCMCTGAIFCSPIRICRWVPSSRPNGWSNCGRSKTDIASAWWKPNTNRWESIRRRIWSGCRPFFEPG